MISTPSSGGARGHPDEGAAFPDVGAETPRAAAAPPSGVWGGNQRFYFIWTAYFSCHHLQNL